MKKSLRETLPERRLVCDGAMGTQLMLAGLASGDCGEQWNLQHPDRVLAIQQRYVAAGADCLITNTFGANRIMLKRHGADQDVRANGDGINPDDLFFLIDHFHGRPGRIRGDHHG